MKRTPTLHSTDLKLNSDIRSSSDKTQNVFKAFKSS